MGDIPRLVVSPDSGNVYFIYSKTPYGRFEKTICVQKSLKATKNNPELGEKREMYVTDWPEFTGDVNILIDNYPSQELKST